MNVTSEADQQELAFWCPAELDAWRAAMARHLEGGGCWEALAMAHAKLWEAYENALNQDLAAC